MKTYWNTPAEGKYVQGETELDFVLDGAIPILQDFFVTDEGNTDTTTPSHSHTFEMFVRDYDGKTKTINLALEVMNPNYIAE